MAMRPVDDTLDALIQPDTITMIAKIVFARADGFESVDDVLSWCFEHIIAASHGIARQIARGEHIGSPFAIAVQHVYLRALAEISRRRRAFAKHADLDPAQLPAPAQNVTDEALWEAVCGLPDEAREIITLIFYRGLSAREVARMLEVAINTVYNRRSSALALLKAQLSDGDDDRRAAA